MGTRGLRASGLQVIYMTSQLVYFLSFPNSLAKQNVAGSWFSCFIKTFLNGSEQKEEKKKKTKELTADREEVGLHGPVFPRAALLPGT